MEVSSAARFALLSLLLVLVLRRRACASCVPPLARSLSPRLAHKLRILWGLRRMRTAPGSLGVPFLGHTYALARGVGRYPCTWDLFSQWSQATAPVRSPGGETCASFSDSPVAGTGVRSPSASRYSRSSAPSSGTRRC